MQRNRSPTTAEQLTISNVCLGSRVGASSAFLSLLPLLLNCPGTIDRGFLVAFSSLSGMGFFLCVCVEISSRTLIPLLRPGSLHSGQRAETSWSTQPDFVGSRVYACLDYLIFFQQSY